MKDEGYRKTIFYRFDAVERFLVHLKQAGLHSNGRVDYIFNDPEPVTYIIDALRLGHSIMAREFYLKSLTK